MMIFLYYLHRKRYEAVVLSDVALEDVGARTEDSLEACPVQLDALQRSTRDYRGSPWPVQQ